MVDREQALAKIQEVVSKQLGVEPEKIVEQASFTNDLGADSLDLVELVMAFEEEFNVDIKDDDVDKLQTVGDAVDFLLRKAEESASS